MAKLNRRRKSAQALENRQLFAADIVQSVIVPLDEAGINTFNQLIYGDLNDPAYDGSGPNSPNLSRTVESEVVITGQTDGTKVYIDYAANGYDDVDVQAWLDLDTSVEGALGTTVEIELDAGEQINLSDLEVDVSSGDRINASAAVSITRQVEDAEFSIGDPSDLESGLITLSDEIYSGDDFAVPFFSADMSGISAETQLYTDVVGFVSASVEGTDFWVTDGDTRHRITPGAAPLEYGDQLVITDQLLRSIRDPDDNTQLFPEGWASIVRVYSDTGEFTLNFAAGNDELNTSYWFEVVPTDNLGSEYLLPLPNNYTSATADAETGDLLYIVHNPTALSQTLTLTTLDSDGNVQVDSSLTLAAGETTVISDLLSAAELSSTGNISVSAFLAGTDEFNSGWGTSLVSNDFLNGDITIGGDAQSLWLTPTARTSILIGGVVGLDGTDQILVTEFAGVDAEGTPLVDALIERVEIDDTNEVWYRFEADALRSYQITNLSEDPLRISTDGDAKVAVVLAPESNQSNSAYGAVAVSAPKLDLYRDLREQVDDDGRVGVAETGDVTLIFENNTADAITFDASNDLTITDVFAEAAAADLYTEVLASNVTVRLVDSFGGVSTNSSATLSDLRTTGIDLYDLFGADSLESGGRVEIVYSITTTATVTPALVEADYALIGTTTITQASTTLAEITSPLNIEVDENPAELVAEANSGSEALEPLFDSSNNPIATIYYDTAENAGDVSIKLDLSIDFNELAISDPGNTSLSILNSDEPPVAVALFEGGVFNGGFTLDGTYGTLFVDSFTPSEGVIRLIYTKDASFFNHSGAGGELVDGFNVSLTNDFYKSIEQPIEVRLQDVGPVNASDSDGGALVEQDTSAALSGNVVTSSGVTGLEPGAVTVVFASSSEESKSVPLAGESIQGQYGTLTVNPDGSYSYSLDEGTTDTIGIAEGESVTETFSIGFGDYDYDLATNDSNYALADLTFTITGKQDVFVVMNTDPFVIPIPENGEVVDHQIVFQSAGGIRQLWVDLDTTTDDQGNVLLLDTLALQDLADNPVTIDTGGGELTLTNFDFVANESGTLTFSFIPTEGAITTATPDKIGFYVQDNYFEELAYDINLDLRPPIPEDGPTITVTDVAPDSEGEYQVEEGGTISQVRVQVSPGRYWRDLTVNDETFIRLTNPIIGKTVDGDYGTLTLLSANSTTGLLIFSYVTDGTAEDHSGAALLDTFDVWSDDWLYNGNTTQFSIEIVDTIPDAENVDFGDAVTGALTEESATTVVTGSLDLVTAAGLDAGTAVVGIDAGEILSEFVSPGTSLLSRADGGTGINGTFGMLWITTDGQIEYELDNARRATQELLEGASVTDTFTYVLGDDDATNDGDTFRGYDLGTIRIFIDGSADPDPILTYDIANRTVPVPENGAIEGQKLTVVADVRDAPGAAIDFLRFDNETELTSAELDLASAAAPIELAVQYGVLSITDFDPATGELTYSYTPTSGVTTNTALQASVQIDVVDTFDEVTSSTLIFDILPPIAETGPVITITDSNAGDPGQFSVVENESLSGIVVNIEPETYVDGMDPGDYWYGVTVNGVSLEDLVANADVLAAPIDIAGTYGVLTFTGANKATGQLNFSYQTTVGPADHTTTPLVDSFVISSEDLLFNSNTETLSINILDTLPTAADLNFGDADTGVLSEDTPTINVTGALDLIAAAGQDLGTRVVGVDAGEILSDFVSPPEDLVSRADGGTGINGTFGTLWITTDGQIEYELDNSRVATQELLEGASVTDTFTYVLGDDDATNDGDTFRGYDLGTIRIFIDGSDDPDPILTYNTANRTVPVPENGTVEDQKLTVVADVRDAPGAAIDFLRFDGKTELTSAQLDLASAAAPIELAVEHGVLSITDFNPATGELTYSYIPSEGVTTNVALQASVQVDVVDTFDEVTSSTLIFDILPPISETGPVITITDSNADDPGQFSVVENESLTGIVVNIEPQTYVDGMAPGDYWYGVTVNGVSLETLVSNADVLAAPIDIVGTYGVLTFTGADRLTGELSFSYQTTSGPADHINAPLVDNFEIYSEDLLFESSTETLSINIVDTLPTASDFNFGTADAGAVAEDGAVVNVTGALNLVAAAGLDAGTAVVGIGAGEILTDFVSAPAELLSRAGGGAGITGTYGALWITADGEIEYELDNAKVQELLQGESFAETFTYVLGDSDATNDGTTYRGYDLGTIRIFIDGADDPDPTLTFSPLNRTVPVPENGSVDNQLLTVEAEVRDAPGAEIDFLRIDATTELSSAQLDLASTAAPIEVAVQHGVIAITDFDPTTGELSYTYTPNEGVTTNSPIQASIQIEVVDTYDESASSTLVFDIYPPIADTGPVITITNTNAGELGEYSVVENEGITEIVVGIEPATYVDPMAPGAYWHGLTVNGVALVTENQVEAAPIQITGAYGVLTFTEADITAGTLTFSYQTTAGPADHTNAPLIDSFEIISEDLLFNTSVDSLDINVVDTLPTAIDVDFGNENDGALQEDNAPFVVTANIDLEAAAGLDEGTAVVGVRAGEVLEPFVSSAATLLSSTTGTGINGVYGTLWITPDGNIRYELDSDRLATQQLLFGETAADVFTYVLGDNDSTNDGVNFRGYDLGTIRVFIDGGEDLSEIRPITRVELLQTDGSGAYVRPVYNQEIGEPAVQQTDIQLQDPNSYGAAEFENTVLADDRSVSSESQMPQDQSLESYEAAIEQFNSVDSLLFDSNIAIYQISAQERAVQISIPDENFGLGDQAGRLSFSATLLDGSALPFWLAIDPEKARVFGNAPDEVSGELLIKLIATDERGQQAEVLVRLIIDERVVRVATDESDAVGESEQSAQPENNADAE